MFVIWTNHGNPKTFIFRGYNPYFGGVKPLFFMVLGPKGMNKANIYQDLQYFFHSVCFFFSLSQWPAKPSPPEILETLPAQTRTVLAFHPYASVLLRVVWMSWSIFFLPMHAWNKQTWKAVSREKTWENPWQKPWQEGEVHWIWNDHPPKKKTEDLPPQCSSYFDILKSPGICRASCFEKGTERKHMKHTSTWYEKTCYLINLKSCCLLTMYTMEDQHGTYKSPIRKGKWCSKAPWLWSMLIFRGAMQLHNKRCWKLKCTSVNDLKK